MRIGVEMFGTQTAGRNRGIGRYCRNVAEALRSRGERQGHEFVFHVVDGLAADQVPVGPNATLRRVKPDPHLRYALTRLARENPDRLDALVLANPLELNPGLDIPARPARGGVPVIAAVVYDLIPLLFPESYLRLWPGTLFARRYLWALERLRTYDLLLAISQSTRDDVIRRLNVPGGKVVAIGTGGDDRGVAFTPARGADDAEFDRAATRRLGLDRPFVFSVAATDARKNLAGLIDAFARLPDDLRSSHRLAVAAGITADHEAAGPFLQRAEEQGVGAALVLTGPVDDPTLRALYRRCAAFAFPSLYEGFGLPVLEALGCGAAVVTGGHSSLSEVAGDAALLANASEPASFASALASILSDASLAGSLRARGPARASQFTWDGVADRALDALRHAVAPSARSRGGTPRTSLLPSFSPPGGEIEGGSRPDWTQGSETPFGRGNAPGPARRRPEDRPERIAMFAPLPPHRSGVANYAAALTEALGERYAIDLYHDERETPFARFRSGGVGSFDHRMFRRVDRTRPYHAIVYQMGNSPAHLFVYDALLRRPGVVVLHDPSLVFFHYERATRLGGGLDAFRRVLRATHADRASEWEPLLAQWSDAPGAMARALVGLGLDMNRLVVGLASAVVVHSRDALARLGPFGAAKAFVVPHGAEPRARPDLRAATRARFGLPTDALVLGAFGIVHPSKLNAATIDAFAAVARAAPGSVLMIVGEEADDGQARRRAEALGMLGDRVRFVGRPGDEEFLALIAATDVGLALRRPPTHGETSGALLHLLRAGVPSVVTDAGAFSEYPDGVVRKIPWPDDLAGISALARALLDLADDPAARAALGRAGLEHVRAHHAWPRVATRYAAAIEWSTRVRVDVSGLPYHGPHPARTVADVPPISTPTDPHRGER